MPRSAADRGFGFKAAGLVRILTTADPEQVLIALEELGLVAEKPLTLLDRIKALVVDLLFEPLEKLIQPLNVALDNFAIVITAAEADLAVGRGGAGAFVVETEVEKEILLQFRNEMSQLINILETSQADYNAKFEAIEQQTEEDVAITFL